MINEMKSELSNRGISFTKVVDISKLPEKETRGYNIAVLIGLVLSPDYIQKLSESDTTDYSEYGEKEHRVGEIAEWLADFIKANGYSAFAQSDKNLINGFFDVTTKTTTLPHKKIAILAGLGWIGKNNLLVSPKYGSAFCMSTVLINAPLPIEDSPIIRPKCGDCSVCKDICPTSVIHGTTWEQGMNRDLIVDVYHCICCLKCLVNCPWTQKYMQNRLS
ncbi:epoxyqueuosine reductase [Lachnospiraceae bacterium MD1]|uniref:Epoxyqueuosine reductase n=1 Tax=Variimorphobacter saccharofermentans TaxID=2755051 RepID=A0A839JY10_9FIRM|nr:epoxyqueuosine reductase [Variimorphobacter saccharofermentans]MBB2182204.1 epoxyqueuosine reductase [Variimorphobacter saccharofermentans]